MLPFQSHILVAVLAGAAAFGAGWQVQAWRWGAADAERMEQERQAREAWESDARQQRRFNDKQAGEHATALALINNQLGDARAYIAKLSNRPCFSGRTAGVLSNIGVTQAPDVRAPAGESAQAPQAPAADPFDESYFVTERDAAAHIAICRASYAEVADQVNQILDIEDERERKAQAQAARDN